MGGGKAAARRRAPAGDGVADRGVRAEEPRRIRSEAGGGGQGSGIESASAMLAETEELVREGRAEDALPTALRALDTVREAAGGEITATSLPALNAVAEIYVELGNAAAAHGYFLQAVSLDPDGRIPEPQGGGAEKFLWLAQLSDEGGQDSVEWFERGAAVLRREIGALGDGGDRVGQEDEKRKKLAGALCGIIEVYMTDLSWDPSAETKCERLISEALLVAPQCAEPLQTLASIRISQTRVAEAKTALRDSMALWQDLPPEEDSAVPDFPTRVSLARLLMEVGMEEEAVGVVERLVLEDDGSVEAWYLGGWCLYLLGGKQGQGERGGNGSRGDAMEGVNGDHGDEEDGDGEAEEHLRTQSMISSREWLRQSLKLYEMVEYEDERLRDHALELVGELDAVIGDEGEEEADGGEEEEEEWDGFGEEDSEEGEEEEHEDEEMGEG